MIEQIKEKSKEEMLAITKKKKKKTFQKCSVVIEKKETILFNLY